MGTGTGDPRIETIRDTVFNFNGVPDQLYNFFSGDGLEVLIQVSPVDTPEGPKTYINGVTVRLNHGEETGWPDTLVTFDMSGLGTVCHKGHRLTVATKACTLDAPGHKGNTQDDWHPLQGVPHANIYSTHPKGYTGEEASGLTVDGDQEGAEETKYRVKL
jgi:hypothetical protein